MKSIPVCNEDMSSKPPESSSVSNFTLVLSHEKHMKSSTNKMDLNKGLNFIIVNQNFYVSNLRILYGMIKT